MNFSINLGEWKSIFAVPSVVVDKYMKLAGATQLKVLLWVLRHAGEGFTEQDIAQVLSMHPADVKDAMQYWVENNIIALSEDGQISPGQASVTEEFSNVVPISTKETPLFKPELRQSSRPQKPDADFVAKRIDESIEIKCLMQYAETILSRPISNGDAALLVMFHDIDGLPVDVIIMLLQYAVSVGKANMKYIEKVAIAWGNEEIDSLEKAEQKIKILEKYTKSWAAFEKIIGLDRRSPTSTESEMVNRWINEWGYSEEMIKEAYDRCVDAKGKYIAKYMDGIIKRWVNTGIKNIQQAAKEKKANSSKVVNERVTSYDIDAYERSSIFD